MGRYGLIARGTWIADRVTDLAGSSAAQAASAAAAPDTVSDTTSMAAQFVVGLPTYTALFALTVVLIRAAVRAHHHATKETHVDAAIR
jgi:hypothetical protein